MIEQDTVIQVPQERETPIQEWQQRARFAYRYAYARSADSRAGGDSGQDYLTLREDGKRLAFALCDGVSQSFMGHLAARALGDALVTWLWHHAAWELDQNGLQTRLSSFLQGLTRDTTPQIEAVLLPPVLPPMVRNVLEQKRRLGSESMFAAGLLDTSADRLLLAWMGDSRLRVWSKHIEPIGADAFTTSERWSTRNGPLGEIHTMMLPLRDVQRLEVYSDGLARLDTFSQSLNNEQVLRLIDEARASPASDDISFLEIKDIQVSPSQEQPASLSPSRFPRSLPSRLPRSLAPRLPRPRKPPRPPRPRTGIGDGSEERSRQLPRHEEPRPRYLESRFPKRVRLGDTVPLEVRIARSSSILQRVALRLFGVSASGTTVTLVLYSEGFVTRGPSVQRVTVPQATDSDWRLFELEARIEGVQSVDVSAYLDGAFLGTLSLTVTVDSRAQTGPSMLVDAPMLLRGAEDGEATLVIRYDRTAGAYRYQLRGSMLGESDEIVLANSLLGPPEAYVQTFAGLLNTQARKLSGFSPTQTRRWLRGLGTELWDQLVPHELKDLYWQYRDRMRRLRILSAGDPIPWEMLYPFRAGGRLDDGFLAEQFTVTRWLFGRQEPRHLSLVAPHFVIPPNAPPSAHSEIMALQAIVGGGMEIKELDPLLDTLDAGRFGLLHFATHNVQQQAFLSASAYVPLGDVHFEQTFLGPEFADRFRQQAPLVFMNACRSDGMAPSYTQLGGWARSFVRAGCGAFVGTLWEVRDDPARQLAEAFYHSLVDGAALGEALRAGRAAIGDREGDPTWLAYTLYGDPQATTTLANPAS